MQSGQAKSEQVTVDWLHLSRCWAHTEEWVRESQPLLSVCLQLSWRHITKSAVTTLCENSCDCGSIRCYGTYSRDTPTTVAPPSLNVLARHSRGASFSVPQIWGALPSLGTSLRISWSWVPTNTLYPFQSQTALLVPLTALLLSLLLNSPFIYVTFTP